MLAKLAEAFPLVLAGMAIGAMLVSALMHHSPRLRAYLRHRRSHQ
jgi:hypothetical protein